MLAEDPEHGGGIKRHRGSRGREGRWSKAGRGKQMAGHVDMAREKQHKVVRKDAGRIKRSGVGDD